MTDDILHSKFLHLYAVVRFDFPISQECPENTVTIVKVFSSKLDAKQEAARLMGINADKGCRYQVMTTRFVA